MSLLTVTADVPLIFEWKSLRESFYKDSKAVENERLDKQLAWLIRITSWAYNIDWDPVAGKVTVSLPLVDTKTRDGVIPGSLPSSINSFDTTRDSADLQLQLSRDAMSNLLIKVMEDVSPRRVLGNFYSPHRG